MELFVDFYISTGDQGPGKDGHSQKDFEHFSNIYIYIYLYSNMRSVTSHVAVSNTCFLFFSLEEGLLFDSYLSGLKFTN